MNLKRRDHHGVISVETAIILIAAVIVEVSLLTVIFSTEFITIQKNKKSYLNRSY